MDSQEEGLAAPPGAPSPSAAAPDGALSAPPPQAAAVATATKGGEFPRVAEEVELIGEQEGSGFREPPSLARRGDGQVIQLTPLLYGVAELSDGEHDVAAIAQALSKKIGRRVSPNNVRTLIDSKLRPLGILTMADGSAQHQDKPDPLLALKFRAALIPEGASRAVGTLLRPLFFPPVILAALGALVATDYWVFFHHGVARAIRSALYSPGVFLLMLAAVVLSAGFHELGHATGCRYGGAEPGKMGCGLYLAWPAFYTDVTDAYRLGKRGRLRTDLGGVYFNTIFIAATMGAYLLTRWEPLIILIVIQHIEIVHQLLPIVRLDGYYIVADLTGVPDLFTRIGPILKSMVPGRQPSDKVRVLKPWVRLVVTAWVLIVVPLLAAQFLILLLHLPRIIGTAYDSFVKQLHTVSRDLGNGHWLGGIGGILQIVALSLPIVGIVLMLARLGKRAFTLAVERTEGKPLARFVVLGLELALVALLAYAWIPKGNYTPIKPNEVGTFAQGVSSLNPLNLTRAQGVAPFTTPSGPVSAATPAPGGSPAGGGAASVLPSPLPLGGAVVTTPQPGPSPPQPGASPRPIVATSPATATSPGTSVSPRPSPAPGGAVAPSPSP